MLVLAQLCLPDTDHFYGRVCFLTKWEDSNPAFKGHSKTVTIQRKGFGARQMEQSPLEIATRNPQCLLGASVGTPPLKPSLLPMQQPQRRPPSMALPSPCFLHISHLSW